MITDKFNPKNLLAIETSCDETAAAVLRDGRQAFQKRRKKLINALKGLASFSQDEILHALEVCGIDPGYRAEVLSIENFVTLSNTLAGTISSGNNTQKDITH